MSHDYESNRLAPLLKHIGQGARSSTLVEIDNKLFSSLSFEQACLHFSGAPIDRPPFSFVSGPCQLVAFYLEAIPRCFR
jgi:hypothetical protein